MLLLRYQNKRQAEGDEGGGGPGRSHSSTSDMRRKINDRDLKGESHRAATRGTLICIFVCGTLLLSLGLTLLLTGLLVPKLKKDPTPWLVTGPTCIVLGILVLLLSVEIILKLRKISADSPSDSRDSRDEETGKLGWGSSSEIRESTDVDGKLTTRIPVIIQPPTPLSQLDASILPLAIPDKH